jgi:hypothetical protein
MKIIYLDQFVLKRASCPSQNDPHKDFFVRIGELCTELASKRVASFPFSESHLKETALLTDTAQRDTIAERASTISTGYQFVSHGSILAQQAMAVRKGIPTDWSPHLVVFRDMIDFRQQLESDNASQRTKKHQALRRVFARWQSLSKSMLASIAQDEADTWGRLLIRDLGKAFGKVPEEVLKLLRTPHFELFNELFWMAEEEGIADPVMDALIFIRDRAIEIPSVRLYGELWGSFARSRRPALADANPSAAEDVHFISSFLPYCDAAFIDNDMCALLPQSKLFQSLKTKVFSLNTKDKFIEYLSLLESKHVIPVSPESFPALANERIPDLQRRGRPLIWICVVPERPDELVSAQRLHLADGSSSSAECNGLAGGGLEWIEELELGNTLAANRLVQIIERALDAMLGREVQHGSSSIRVGYFLLNCDGWTITDSSDAGPIFVRGDVFKLGVADSLIRSRNLLSSPVAEMLMALSVEADAANLAK